MQVQFHKTKKAYASSYRSANDTTSEENQGNDDTGGVQSISPVNTDAG